MIKNPFSFLTIVIALIILIFAVMSSYLYLKEFYPISVSSDIIGTSCPDVTLPSCEAYRGSFMCYEEMQDYIETYPDCKSDMLPFISPSPMTTDKKCIVGGCSGEICQSSDEPPAVSICLYNPSYACYKSARCQVQENGICGWTPTLQLSQCINRAATGGTEDIPQ